MTWSLNEIEALARKATRGAGYAWGLSEEAGRAIRWTCAAGWPGASALADLLTHNDQAAPAALRPQRLDDTWAAADGALCPIVTGATLCDLASDWAKGRSLTLGPVAHPMLLIPYMVWAADGTGTPLTLAWQTCRITRNAGETTVEDPDSTLTCPVTQQAHLSPAGSAYAPPLKRTYRATPTQDAIAILNAFAQRTYAPETDESRRAGAGAGLTDND